MSPEKPFSRARSRGFLIPLAAIVVVGIAVLAIAISDMAAQSSQAVVVEGLSVQAFYAAESGAYYGMHQLLFDVSDRAVADANCIALNGSTLNFTALGLQACSSDIFCTTATAAGNPQSFYTIRSEASCGAGDLTAERIIEVTSFL